MESSIGVLLEGWRHNLAFAEALLRDAPEDQRTTQPGSVVNHPAWTLGHLSHCHPAIPSLAQGQPVDDPGRRPNATVFDEGAAPADDPGQYPTLNDLLAQFRQGHARVEEALQTAAPETLIQPPGLNRWAAAPQISPMTPEARECTPARSRKSHPGGVILIRVRSRSAAFQAARTPAKTLASFLLPRHSRKGRSGGAGRPVCRIRQSHPGGMTEGSQGWSARSARYPWIP